MWSKHNIAIIDPSLIFVDAMKPVKHFVAVINAFLLPTLLVALFHS
jgi:hypothetical protein